ncbi:MAG: ribonuclease P protein component [Eubacteriales bacterium]|nr:ribonuclease P protein component [Eubacteriales bacterium]
MQEKYRLKKSGTFQYVYRRGSSTACKEMVLLYAKSRQVKVGFSVGKKVGNAVIRNFTKRRLRALIRPYLSQLKKGNYIIVARASAASASFAHLQNQMLYLLKKLSLLSNANEDV